MLRQREFRRCPDCVDFQYNRNALILAYSKKVSHTASASNWKTQELTVADSVSGSLPRALASRWSTHLDRWVVCYSPLIYIAGFEGLKKTVLNSLMLALISCSVFMRLGFDLFTQLLILSYHEQRKTNHRIQRNDMFSSSWYSKQISYVLMLQC